MLTLNKYIINIIAQLTPHPHRLRVSKRMRDCIQIIVPHSIIYRNIRIFTPLYYFPDSSNLKLMKFEDTSESMIKNSKILIIYTSMPIYSEILHGIIDMWNHKYAFYYIYRGVEFEHLKNEKNRVLILGFQSGETVVKFRLDNSYNTEFGVFHTMNIMEKYRLQKFMLD